MKNRFATILSLLCALLLAAGAVSACADTLPATPSDLPAPEEELVPAETQEEADTEPEAGTEEEPAEESGDKDQPAEADPAGEDAKEAAAGDEAEAVKEADQAETETLPEDPQDEPEEIPAETGENPEEPKVSAELIITKSIRLGGVWEGLTRDNNPVTLKLDLDKAENVHLIVEGKKDVWATVEKSDRPEASPRKTLSDPQTKRLIISFEAEQGSYLIRIAPEEPNRNAMITVSFLDDEGYRAWEASLADEKEPAAEEVPEQIGDQETETDPDQPEEHPAEAEDEIPADDGEPEADLPAETGADQPEETENRPESELPADRSIDVSLTWDTENPQVGDTAHLQATLNGYDALDYTLQWQYSEDDRNWTDAVGETGDRIDITITEENNYFYWRILVYIEQPDAA